MPIDCFLSLSFFSGSGSGSGSGSVSFFLGLTFEELGKIIGKDELWVAAAFYGQARITLMVIFILRKNDKN